jgi:exosortase/archaeosortase family protein
MFIVLFLAFYYFNIFFFGITTPGNHYSAIIDQNFNYIRGLRHLLLGSSAWVLRLFGFVVITNDTELLVAGQGAIQVVYSCLGLGVLSFFAAFVISYPNKIKSKIIFLVGGVLGIEMLNVLRFILLALFWNPRDQRIIDHHTLFNITIYLVIAAAIYLWVKSDSKQQFPAG